MNPHKMEHFGSDFSQTGTFWELFTFLLASRKRAGIGIEFTGLG